MGGGGRGRREHYSGFYTNKVHFEIMIQAYKSDLLVVSELELGFGDVGEAQGISFQGKSISKGLAAAVRM